MKTNLIFILLIAVLFGACFSPWEGGEGNLTIVWGNTGKSRDFFQEDKLPDLSYTVTLTGPGARQEEKFSGVPSASFKVIPGLWTVTVKGYLTEENLAGPIGTVKLTLKVMGIEQVEVTAGKNDPKMIRIYTATEVGSWNDLNEFINLSDNALKWVPSDPREELLILKDSPDGWDYPSGNKIEIKRPIILIAEEKIIINRVYDSGNIYAFFSVTEHGHLTLGLNGMTGTLTLNGNKDPSGEALLDVGSYSPSPYYPKLTINDGVILTGSAAAWGGGVYVNFGASFTMNGGTISGNTANQGGGVHVANGSEFIMNGGTISGNTANQGGGVFVSFQTGNPSISSFTMNGGTISGNTANYNNGGGGVYIQAPSIFTQNGGTVSGNVDYEGTYPP